MKQGCSAESGGAERVPLDPNRIIPAWEVFETRPVPIGFALREHLLFPRPLFRPDSRGTHVRDRFRCFNSAYRQIPSTLVALYPAACVHSFVRRWARPDFCSAIGAGTND